MSEILVVLELRAGETPEHRGEALPKAHFGPWGETVPKAAAAFERDTGRELPELRWLRGSELWVAPVLVVIDAGAVPDGAGCWLRVADGLWRAVLSSYMGGQWLPLVCTGHTYETREEALLTLIRFSGAIEMARLPGW